MSSTANRVIKNTGFLYAKMGITMFISLYTTRLILNSLGASDFGVFNIVGGAIAMLGFLNVSMASATQRFMSYSEGEGDFEKQKVIFNISVVLHFIIALIVGVLLVISGILFFHAIFNIPPDRMLAAKVVYCSLIISTMFTVMSVPYDAVINAHENMKYYAIVGIVESLLKLIVAIICVVTVFDKLMVYGILMSSIPFITLTIMRIYCHKYYKECELNIRLYYNHSCMIEMMTFASWNFLGTAASMIGNYGLNILLNNFFGTIVNAAQGIANQLNGQLLVFTNNMIKALNPVIVKSEGAGNREKMIYSSMLGCKYSFLMLAIFAIPVLIEMPYILKVWLKEVPEWTIVFSRLCIIRTLIEQTTISLRTGIAAQGNIKKVNLVSCILNLLPIFIIYLLFELGFSPTSMYLVNIIIFGFIYSLMLVYFMKKNSGMSYVIFLKQVLFPIIICFFVTYVISYIPSLIMIEGFERFLLTLSISLFVFVLVNIKLLSIQEKDNLVILKDKFKAYFSNIHY